MWKSKKFIIITAVVAVVILIGATAGVALAANAEDADREPGELLVRVAEILGIPQDDLVNAFKQASQELREQRRDQYFQKLVGEGELTEEQADEYRQWMESKPDVPLPAPHRMNRFPFRFNQLPLPETQ